MAEAPSVVPEAHEHATYQPPEKMFAKHPSQPHIANLEDYQKLYKESITEPNKFWGRTARELLTWHRDFETVSAGSLADGDVKWFVEGQLNACYNAVDRHAYKDPNRVALIYEADEVNDGRNVTYGELLRDVSKVAWVLKQAGIKKGDTVAIYMPMIPEAVVAILACVRIGAVHSVVFAGFSADALRDLVFEGTPAYPNFSRYWDIIEKHNITQFYVAPTALRLLKRAGDEHVRGNFKYLRTLGSVGEPIAAEVWKWYYEVVGKESAHVVDTYWQTETGSNVITPLAGVTPMKPGSASLPFFGIEPAIIDPVSGEELHGNNVEGVLAFKQSWPSIARTVYGSHKRYLDTYLHVYKGYYFTGDGAARDHEGFYWIRGRVDDVVNVSGHRLSTAEIEAALIEHHAVAEAAVVGVSDELTGQAVNAFVALKDGNEANDALRKELVLQVRKSIGPFAAPKAVFIIGDLPKTRSGKIMRRILRKVLAGEEDQLGDVSTLSDPSVVAKIIATVHETRGK
ncbi:acetyl-CoA synthetase-like protein [Trichoderma longibrachiatum ATCC 18648]|uniref:acetate--CoA ligase n=1 Tax=Trichoderma longibrachiatum ATCC 18648 TaxID=983965 RepID=A0A2T4CCY0_TRILO|nr:acetyl-CoA synthetase-like protein [Trichoderma longibrachiatum ATCC 18648]